MKKFYSFLLLFTALVTGQINAQTPSNCSANFSFTVAGNSVNFLSVSQNTSVQHVWSFGDGTGANIPNPAHTYANCGTYLVRHYTSVTTPNGVVCADSMLATVNLQCPSSCNMQASFNFAPLPAQPNVYAFTNTSSGFAAGDSIRWTFGDGSISTDLNPVHTFPGPGVYNVCIRIKKNNLPPGTAPCVREFCRTITIANSSACNIIPGYNVSVPNPAQPNVLMFINASVGASPNAQIQWTFGDGTSDTGQVVTHLFTQTGPYNVCIRVINSNTCSADTCFPVTVTLPTNCGLQASFTFAPVPGQAGTFQFTNTSAGFAAGDSIRWTFGDGSAPSYDVNPVHTFTPGAAYSVCLRIKRNNLPPGTAPCVSELCRSVLVIAPCNLTASFTATIPNSSQPNVVVFTNTSAGSTANTQVSWTFGDGSAGAGNVVTHLYQQPGNYQVCIRVAQSNSCVAETCQVITVTVPPTSCNMQANFFFAPVPNQVNTMQFTNNSPGFAAGDSIRWTFGDGSAPSFDVNPIHTFPAGGVYYVCLRIARYTQPGTAPCVREICRNVTVAGNQPCNLSPSFAYQASPNQPNVITFVNTSITTNAPAVTWNFGDNSTGSGNIVTHTYNQGGTYRVCMRIAVSNTCATDTCIMVTVGNPVPQTCNLAASFTYQTGPSTTGNGTSVYFQNSSIGIAPGDSIRWTFGDGTGSTLLNPIKIYTFPGTYRVCLRIKKNNQPAGTAPCVSEFCSMITIQAPAPINCDSVNVRYTYTRDILMPNRIYFRGVSNYPFRQQSWTITPLNGNGQPVTLNYFNPSWVFSQTGSYLVCLRAATAGACIKEYCDTIQINTVYQQCQLLAFPNPATTQVSVNAVLNAPSLITATLLNSQNVVLQRNVRGGIPGTNLITFNVANLPAGWYTIRLFYNNRTCVARFQKL